MSFKASVRILHEQYSDWKILQILLLNFIVGKEDEP